MTPTREPRARLASLGDAPAMLRVLEAAFGTWPAFPLSADPLDHLRWKMSPPDLDAGHTVVELDGELVAVSLRWVTRFQLGNEILIQNCGVDQAVLPSMQGRGIGRLLATAANDSALTNSDFSFSTGSRDPRIPSIFDAFDPTMVEYPVERVAWTRGPRATFALHRQSGELPRLARSALRSLLRRPRPVQLPAGLRIEEISSFDERADQLWVAFAPSIEAGTVRDSSYLNWRYADPRAGDATILGAFQDDRMRGYVVTRPHQDTALVVDMVIDPGIPALIGPLLIGAAKSNPETRTMSCWLPPAEARDIAGSVPGFHHTAERTTFIAGAQRRRRASAALDRFYAGDARVYATMGDSDFV